MSVPTPTAQTIVNDAWAWLAEHAWAGTDLAEVDDATPDRVFAEIEFTYPGGLDQFLTDRHPVTFLDYREDARTAGQVAR